MTTPALPPSLTHAIYRTPDELEEIAFNSGARIEFDGDWAVLTTWGITYYANAPGMTQHRAPGAAGLMREVLR